MDFSEKWGTSIEEAVDLALADLKLGRDEVEVIVLEQPSKGFFGIGSKLAKVRVEKKKPEKVKEEKINKKSKEIKNEKNEIKSEVKDEAEEKKPVREKETKKEIERKAQKRPDNLKPAPSDNAALVFLK